jgi:hypothetical protein
MKKQILTLLLATVAASLSAQFVVGPGRTTSLHTDAAEAPVVQTAAQLLRADWRKVFADSLQARRSGRSRIIAGTITQPAMRRYAAWGQDLRGAHEAFLLKVLDGGELLVLGSDAHGTAYGLLEMSRLIGVSPWEWWADATPAQRQHFELPAGYSRREQPDVAYRGIFINDEDWGLMPWSTTHHDPTSAKGAIGPKTYSRVFELLLRLRANTLWPAMHECTVPFFLVEGNREAAARYGIYIGGSHCEPMGCSTAGEWPRRGQGDYDYTRNAAAVRQFWSDRLREVGTQEMLYTLGMRGEHDGPMRGVSGDIGEQRDVLQRVIDDQRALLQQYAGTDLTRIPQVFIPYKEVLDIYNAGLRVPDDVTLMWCDDNYGYIRHFPDAAEQQRAGGNGVYYHVSYWGRPHDYLWLGTFSPFLLHQQMAAAYAHGVRRIWVLNVGDIKPCEYQMELFMDMAWNIRAVNEAGVDAHLQRFLAREFGQAQANRLLPAMKEHYRLAYIRRPEMMGGTRVEEADRQKWNTIVDLPWTEAEIRERLATYARLSDVAESVAQEVGDARRDCFFQLVQYPLQAADQMNRKLLYAQLARHGRADWRLSDAAYDSIVRLTARYDSGFSNAGKWRGMMDMQPRQLPVFGRVPHTTAEAPLPTEPAAQVVISATRIHTLNAEANPRLHLIAGLGYGDGALALPQGSPADVPFTTAAAADSITMECAFVPTHPTTGERLRVAVSIDHAAPVVADYATQGRSEAWKQNVLRNQAIVRLRLPLGSGRDHVLRIRAVDPDVLLDQVRIIEAE